MQNKALWAGTERIAFTIWLAASAAACTSWHTETVAPERVIAEKHPEKVRVTRLDSSRVELHAPELSGDTLIGMVYSTVVVDTGTASAGAIGALPTPSTSSTEARMRIPVDDVARIQTHRVSAGKTFLLFFSIAAVAVVAAGAGMLVALGSEGL